MFTETTYRRTHEPAAQPPRPAPNFTQAATFYANPAPAPRLLPQATNTEVVLANFDLGRTPLGKPFNPTQAQRHSLDAYGRHNGYGCWDKPGTGKTLTMTLHALLAMADKQIKRAVVLTPPAVIPNWVAFLSGISSRTTGQKINAVAYMGTPTQRRKIDLAHAHFAVMSYEIFKGDFAYLSELYLKRMKAGGVMLICDEAHKLKNRTTENYRHVASWYSQGVPLKLATGTPVSTPLDIYTYTRFKNPGAYRNVRHFMDTHVPPDGYDPYDAPTKWINLGLAKENHMAGATQTLLQDVVKDLPALSVQEWGYNLAPAHAKLYKKIAEKQLAEVESAQGEVTAISESAIYHACQQVVLNPGKYGLQIAPQAIALAEQWLDELGEEKLVVVANYQSSNEMLFEALSKYGARLIYGPLSQAAKMRAKDEFIHNPAARVLVMQPEAGGVGVDGLQFASHSMLFLEAPSIVRQFEQAVARLMRTGQQKPVQVRIAVAAGTVQVRGYRRLLANDELVAQVQRTHATLRDMILGVN